MSCVDLIQKFDLVKLFHVMGDSNGVDRIQKISDKSEWYKMNLPFIQET